MHAVTHKVCGFCESEVAIEHFKRDARTTDGYSIYCVYCQDSIDPSSVDPEHAPQFKPRLRCSRCGEFKARTEFSPNKHTRTGKHSWCRPCTRAYHKTWRGAALKMPRRSHLEEDVRSYLRTVAKVADPTKMFDDHDPAQLLKDLCAWFDGTNPERIRATLYKIAEERRQ